MRLNRKPHERGGRGTVIAVGAQSLQTDYETAVRAHPITGRGALPRIPGGLMRRSILCIAILAFLALVRIPAAAATDPYGGITELKIPGAPAGRWSVATLTQADGTRRLVFVTPAGNAFWLRGVYSVNTN